MTGYTTEAPITTPRVAEAITDGDGPTMGRVTFDAYVTNVKADIPKTVAYGQNGMIAMTTGGPFKLTLELAPDGAVKGPLNGKRIRIEVLDDE